MKFTATLQLHGKNATGIVVPPEVVEAIGGGKRPKVSATLNGYRYRSSVAPMDGESLLPVSAEVRAGAGISAGDEVEVVLELDDAPRVVEVPADLAAALDDDAVAKAAFGKMSYSHQRQHVLAIEGAKAPETRSRRVAKTLEMLREKS